MSNYGELISGNKLVLVDFFATWCGPCKTLGPILEDVSRQMTGKVRIVKVDVDKNQSLAGKLEVRGVPTMILYKEGKQVWRQSGVIPAGDLVRMITTHA
jgi:thioredoxin 1